MSVIVQDPKGQTLIPEACLVLTLAAVERGECIQVGPTTFRMFDYIDFRCQPRLTPTQRRRIYLRSVRKAA